MAIEWKAQQLRFTAFLAQPSSEIDYKQLWLKATGLELDEVNTQPKLQVQVFKSNTDEYQVILQVGRERIDLVFHPLESFVPIGVLELGAFQPRIENFRKFVHQWLDTDGWPQVNRVAIGAVLFNVTPNLISARQIMLDMVPSLNIDASSNIKELLFQINRPRVLSVQGQEIEFNRLAKWSAAQLVETVISAEPILSRVDKTSMAVLELDMSTAVDTAATYNSQFQGNTVDNLIEMAVEISERGDVEE